MDTEHPTRLLLVEDEFLVRLTLGEALRDEGYDVIEAGTADEALQRLEEGLVRLMLTDIQLPGSMDGRGLVRRVRETLPELPVIFMTGRPETMGGATRTAHEAFIAKPYLPSDVVATVARLIGASAK